MYMPTSDEDGIWQLYEEYGDELIREEERVPAGIGCLDLVPRRDGMLLQIATSDSPLATSLKVVT